MIEFFKRRFIIVALILILIIGFTVRVWDVSNNPAGFFCDEASFEYNAYSILKTGKDEFAVPFPVYFKAFGEYKNPVYIYSAIPFVLIFGLNEFSIRFTSIIYGIMTIIVLFFLVKKLFNEKVAIISSLFLAISPWHIHFSRFGFEVISTPFWVCLSLLLLIKSLRNFKFYPFAVISFIITFLTYNPPKIYLPPLILSFMLINNKKTLLWVKSKKFWLFSILGLLILFLLIGPYLINGAFFVRWNEVRMQSMTLINIIRAYLNHFSLTFLFKTGEIDYPGSFITRTSIRGIGELYWFQLPLIFYGLLSCVITKNYRKSKLLILALLLIYPLSSIFTITIPSATRSIIGIIPFQIFSAIGLYEFILIIKSNFYRKLIIYFLSIIIVVSFIFFIMKLSKYPDYSSDFWGWQYGPREIISYFKTQTKNYDELYMTGYFNAPEIFLKFYDPENKCKNCFVGGIDRFDKNKKQLFTLNIEEIRDLKIKYKIKKIIYYPNGKKAFYFLENIMN